LLAAERICPPRSALSQIIERITRREAHLLSLKAHQSAALPRMWMPALYIYIIRYARANKHEYSYLRGEYNGVRDAHSGGPGKGGF